MKQSIFLFVSLLFMTHLISCSGNDFVDENTPEKKIPIDSISISFKIDGQQFSLKSPDVNVLLSGSSAQRAYRIKNSLKDSLIIGYYHSFYNDSLTVEFGFSRSVLADTTYLFFTSDISYKDQIYSVGSYLPLFAEPLSALQSDISQNEGFYISIFNRKTGKYWTSYRRTGADHSQASYEAFKKEASCKITNARALDSGIYSDYTNARFVEAEFECALYEVTFNAVKNNRKLTVGRLSGVF